MTEAQIAEQVRRFPPLRLHRPDGKEQLLVAQTGDTLIHLELENDRLRSYQLSWTSGFTRQSYALKTDVCSAQQLVELHVLGDPKDHRARVLLDGEKVGELSKQGTFILDVPLGRHSLTIELPDSRSWSTELRYDESSSGYDRLPIPDDAFGASGAGPSR